MISIASLRSLVAAGMTAEQIVDVVETELRAAEVEADRKRQLATAKQARWRAGRRLQQSTENRAVDVYSGDVDGGRRLQASTPAQTIVSIEDFKASVDADDKIAPKESYLLTSIEDSQRKKKEVVARAREGRNALQRDRGTRLPEEWAPDADGSIMAADALGPERYLTELAKFRDYWRAQPGVRGRKVDWDATFRNWIRNAGERKGNGHGQKSGSRIIQAADDLCRKIAEFDGPQQLRDIQGAVVVGLLPKR